MDDDDDSLVRMYVYAKSDAAFETLCARYLNLVYSAALRKTGDAHLAEDVTQAVFVVLARKASSLAAGTVLPAWLLSTTRLVANNALRQQLGQRKIVEAAVQAQRQSSSTDAKWSEIAPLLDDALDDLSADDRSIVVLRYFQKQSFESVAGKLGISSETARKRVERALDKLRKSLIQKGVVVGAVALGTAISAGAIHAAPAGLAAAIPAALASAQAGVQLTPVISLAKGALKTMAIGSAKSTALLAVGAVFFMVLGGGAVSHWSGMGSSIQPPTAAPAALRPVDRAPLSEPDATPAVAEEKRVDPRPVPKETPPQAEPAVVVDLMPLIDAKADVVSANWQFENGALHLTSETAYSRFEFPYRPAQEYDFKIEFTVDKANQEIIMLCSKGNALFAWKIGRDDNTFSALEEIGETRNGNNVTKRTAKSVYTPGQRTTAVIEVRNSGVTAILNGETWAHYETDFKDLHMTNAWRTATPGCLGVGSYMTPFTLNAASVTEVTGRGTALRAPGVKGVPRFPEAAADAEWEKAVDLLPMIDAKRDTVAGTWSRSDAGLACTAEPLARLEIPYKPPEEYDFKMVFTYASGDPEIHQFVAKGNRTFEWCPHGWKKGLEKCASFQSFDRYPKDTINPSTIYLPDGLKPNQTHTSIVQVRQSVATAWLDGKMISQHVIGFSDAHESKNWVMPTKGLLGVGSNNCAITIQRLDVLEIGGKGANVDAAALRQNQSVPARPPTPKKDDF